MPVLFDQDISHLYPPFAASVLAVLAKLHSAGLNVYVFEGLRPMDQQALRWVQGRTAPGNIVTRAKPGYSWHQYGCAVDLVFGGPGRWSWNDSYEGVEKIMRANGFESLSFERPHFQKTYGLDIDDAFSLCHISGLAAVWKKFDQLRAKPGSVA